MEGCESGLKIQQHHTDDANGMQPGMLHAEDFNMASQGEIQNRGYIDTCNLRNMNAGMGEDRRC